MRRPVFLVLAGLLILAACSDSDPAGNPASSGSSSAAPATAGLATAELTLTGDGGLTGAATDLSVRCDFPDPDGPSIAVLGKAYDGVTTVRVGVFAGKVSVIVFGTGSDGASVQRTFEGSGVSDFDE